MIQFRLYLGFLVSTCFGCGVIFAQQPAPQKQNDLLPLTKLSPAKPHTGLCVLSYRISTTSPECQAYFDQGLAYFYSYVYLEAARSFETATRYDPNCAIAYWGLSRAQDNPNSRGDANISLKKAQDLLPHANDREKLLITARLQEKGMLPGIGPGDRKKQAFKSLDELLTLYDDDEEGWFYRAKLTQSNDGMASIPYYKALLRINPLHPGANHELVHFYETIQRPALGWKYAEKYLESSPGIPHPFHMQAHLATRLGKWDRTCDRSTHAVELERAYHKDMNVKPSDDYQYGHHLEILTLSLIHDGRFREARAIKQEAWDDGIRQWQPWFRLHLAERDWDEALKAVAEIRKSDKITGSYLAALAYLKMGDPGRAAPEVEVLDQAYAASKTNKELEYRLWEAQGLLLCETGGVEAGLKLLTRAVEASKNNFHHHSWGNGAYYMEEWGTAALCGGKADVAEEAFLEALAHDPGSVRAALGLQVLCERQGRDDEARRYGELARRCWRRAEVQTLESELACLRKAEFVTNSKPASGHAVAAPAIDSK
jgi:tetratricopeptide (TPR) repeat protein